MADTLDTMPDLVTATDTADHEIIFQPGPGNDVTIILEIVSGTFKFAVGESAANSGASWTTAGTKVPVTLYGRTLHYKATTIGDTFRYSW